MFMRMLSNTEMDLLLEFFEEEPGYVLDFSDWAFNEFTKREIGVRVKDLYQDEGLSKHKSLCRFCKTPGNEEKAYKLLSSLMNYFDLKLRSKYTFNEQGERLYIKCKEILRAFSSIDSRSPQLSLDEMNGKLRALYQDGAMFLVAGGEDKITIGLTHLAAFIEAAIKCNELRIFGHPLVIRVLNDLAQLGGMSIRPTETKLAESAWREFSNKVRALLLLITKRAEFAEAATDIRFKLSRCFQRQITEKAGGYDFYRSISTSVLRELMDCFKTMAIKCHPQHKDTLELMYCGIFNNEWDAFDFLPVGEGNKTDTRYAAVERSLAVCAKMPPSVARFQFLCSAIKDGIEAACNGDADLNVWESAWLTAALQLLAENPCPDGCDLIDRQNLYRAILPAFSKIIALFSLVQNEDPDMLADELDYFYQDVNEVMRQNWSSDPRTGEKGVVLTPSFVTRDGINGDWEFNDVYIRRLASHCSAKDAIKRFREMEVSDSDRSTIDAVGADKSEAGCGSLSEHLLFVQAIDAASGLVSSLEVADDVGVKVVVASEEVFGRAIQPFFGTYFRPYTRYPKKLEKDKELGLDIQSDITQLKGLIERIFTRISKIKGVELPLQEAKGSWKKICTLYDFRMKNPFVRLSRKAQEDYADLFIQIGRQLVACSKEDNEVRMSEQSGQSAPAEMAKAVVAELKPELEALKRQGENMNRNVLRCGGKLVNEVAQVRKNTQTLLREQCVDEELTAHDNEVYKPRYEGVDLEMLQKAYALFVDGGLTRASAASRVFREYSDKGAKFSFTKLENFRTVVYRYCEGMSR